jgi:hypothetical protein
MLPLRLHPVVILISSDPGIRKSQENEQEEEEEGKEEDMYVTPLIIKCLLQVGDIHILTGSFTQPLRSTYHAKGEL